MLASESVPDAAGSQGAAASRRPRRGWPRRFIVGAVLAAWIGTAYWQTHKPLPRGVHLATDWYPTAPQDARFIADITTADGYGRPVLSHAVFDEMLALVRGAREYIVIDAFRFDPVGSPGGGSGARARPVAAELRDVLIARKRAVPGLRVLFVTDPANIAFGSNPSADLERLERAGIDVVVTDLDPLRDPNYLYSSLWRLAARWWARPGPERSTILAWLAAANLKADRRNVVIADDGRGGINGILSASELGPSGGADSNVAVRLAGSVLIPLLRSELDIARFSGWTGVLGAPTDAAAEAPADAPPAAPTEIPTEAPARAPPATAPGQIEARLLTEGAIGDTLVNRIDSTRIGDHIAIAAFYLADRGLIESLVAASRRGVDVRLILDPGEDAFGRTGAGIPNRSVAGELLAASDGAIRVRWYRTHGERFHTGLVLIYGPRQFWLLAGSANLTRRGLGDYDLDANAAISAQRDAPLALQAIDYFETLWSNRAGLGIEYTADVGVYADGSQLNYWRYRLMEATGLSRF